MDMLVCTPGVSIGVRWCRPSFNDTKGNLKRVCEICHVNASKMFKCSGCNVPIIAPLNAKKKLGIDVTSTRVKI
jgi:hypothetical protein